ncbi:MAG: NADH-quinone oxidoreductase subunit L [Rickettsiales bacterium]|nr:NADH-quinone oxidoreductase subunit L [Rickettsiales bacterium]
MLWLIVWLPFLGFLGGSLFGRYMGKGVVVFTTFNIGFSCILSLITLINNFFLNKISLLPLSVWIVSDFLEIKWEFYCDNLTLFMAIIVTFISTLVHLYASEYMAYDPHLQRFMCYLSLFTFFMLVLITGSNFVQMFVGWEGVGLSSYLLINFWFTRIQANKAAIKAMLFNRVADLLMLLALFSIYLIFETFDYNIIFSITPLILNFDITLGNKFISSVDFICIFLFLGAMGKSAQLGFHNWLPDAMEGPTPVSALIHAATMVTAGVFLLMRCSYLFELSPIALNFITVVGSITALFGATTGLFFHDLKRVIAFSTCSQLGYMMLACGLGRYNAAFFHLVTHAFFKALLFLAAGAIIHAAFDEQDTRKLGGFLRYLPITYICFLIGSLNLIGTPFLSGFFTKDLILELALVTYSTNGCFAYLLGIISIFFTSAYSTRTLILIFISENNASRYFIKNTQENGWKILLPLVVLTFISILAGYVCIDLFAGVGTSFFGTSFFFNLNTNNNIDIEFIYWPFKFLPLLITFTGISFSIFMYILEKKLLIKLKKFKLFKTFYFFLIKKWYADRFINESISTTILNFSQTYLYNNLERGLLEFVGPTTISKNTNNIAYSSNDIVKVLPQIFY